MENVIVIKNGEKFTPPEISTDFYIKLQSFILLSVNPDFLSDIKTEDQDKFKHLIEPALEFIAACENKLVKDGLTETINGD